MAESCLGKGGRGSRSDPAPQRLSRAAGAGVETRTRLLLCSKKNTGTLLGPGSAFLLSHGKKELEEANMKKAEESWKDLGTVGDQGGG